MERKKLVSLRRTKKTTIMKISSITLALCFCCILYCNGLTSCSSDNDTSTVPHINSSDSMALVSIYKQIGPWSKEWDLKDITTWNGVQTALDVDRNEIRVIGFEVYNGSFKGKLPKEFCQLTELKRLVISGGSMEGTIPEELGDLKKLYYLCIANNNVHGPIPESIGKLTDLRELQLMNNKISGTIPNSFGKLTNLETLYITGTKITGEIPKGLSNMNKLAVVALSNNEFSGSFPIEILRNNLFIMCENNNITDLPFEVWDDNSNLIPPMLKNNRLSGIIPEWIKQTKKWQEYKSICIGKQQDHYGYSNY